MRPAGVELCGISFQRVILTGKMPIPQLQFDRFHFSDESLVIVRKERTNHVEHGVTEATDVHDVSSLTSLNRLVRLQIDIDQLRVSFLTRQLSLVGKYAQHGRDLIG